jgi:Tfp pilus assembly protein PilX
MALLAVLMVVFLLTLLGMTSMQLAGQEIIGTTCVTRRAACTPRR